MLGRCRPASRGGAGPGHPIAFLSLKEEERGESQNDSIVDDGRTQRGPSAWGMFVFGLKKEGHLATGWHGWTSRTLCPVTSATHRKTQSVGFHIHEATGVVGQIHRERM